MKKFIQIGTLFFIICSCTDKSPTIRVVNKSERVIDSVRIKNSGGDQLKFDNINKGTSIEGNLVFTERTTNDGGYFVQIYSNGVSRNKTFGYYSNGTPLDRSFEITINENDIMVKAN